MFKNEITIISTKWLYWLVCGFRSTIHHIATGYAGGRVFNGNGDWEVITLPFLMVCAGKYKLHRIYTAGRGKFMAG